MHQTLCAGAQGSCVPANLSTRQCRRRCRSFRARAVVHEQLDTSTTLPVHIESFGFRTGFLYEFDRGPMIGSGSFGVVHVARHIKSGHKYAVKSIPKVFDGYYLDHAFAQRIFHEVDIARHMGQSLNVIHLVEAFEDDINVDLVLELAAGDNLWGRMKQGAVREDNAARIIADILRAVAQCHAKGVILRDVKPDNFLFMSRRETSPLKMVDFGLAQFCKPGQTFTERAGTPFYVAPEVLKQAYSCPADVWSAGVTAYQLLSGRLPWSNDVEWVSELANVSSVTSGIGGSGVQGLAGHGGGGPNIPTGVLWRAILSAELDFTWPPWDTISDGARDLVSSMLQRDPQLRPTAAELLHHPWLAAATQCRTCWTGSGSNGSSNGGNGSSSYVAPVNGSSSNGRTSNGSNGHSSNGSNGRQQQQESVPLYLRPLEDSLVQRLQRYGTFSKVKQAALRRLAAVMSPLLPQPPCLAAYAAEFAALDPGGEGRIPADTLVDLLSSNKWDLSDVEVRMLVAQFDLDHDGCVDFCEWMAALIDWPQAQAYPQWKDWITQVFMSVDVDGDGLISPQELLVLLRGPGGHNNSLRGWSELDGPLQLDESAAGSSSSMMPDELSVVLRRADVDGDGQLSFEEFVALVETNEDDQLDLFPSRRCMDGSSQPVLVAHQQHRGM